MRDWKQKLKQNYKKLIIGLIIFLLCYMIFGRSFKLVVVVIAFIIIGAMSTFYQNFVRVPIQFELVKFVTILTAVAFGAIPAILVGIISSFIGKIITGKLEADFLGSILAICVISFIGSSFAGADIVTLGIILVLIYHAIIFPIALTMGGNLGYGIIYSGSNIIFNILVFMYLARPILWLIR